MGLDLKIEVILIGAGLEACTFLLAYHKSTVPNKIFQAFRFPVDKSSTAYKASELFGVISQNIINPKKLWPNIRHPISEWIHTAHHFYALDEAEGAIYLNEHYFFSKFTTVDVLRPNENGDYYGKAELTGRMFSLVRRIYAKEPEYKHQLADVLQSEGITDGLEAVLDGVGKLKVRDDSQKGVGLVERSKLFAFAVGHLYLAGLFFGKEGQEFSPYSEVTYPHFRLGRQIYAGLSLAEFQTAFTGRDYRAAAVARKEKFMLGICES